MTPIVSIMSQGSMAAGIASRLVDHGVEVRTILDGRSAASVERANNAGMTAASPDDFAAADLVLSILPPDQAVPLATRLAPHLAGTARKPVYLDLNAISPETAGAVERCIVGTGCAFVDGGIIGGPPRGGYDGPTIYLSGAQAPAGAILGEHGLDVRVLDAPVGAASALKMCYGGITKGVTAIGSAMVLAAERAGIADILHAEMSDSQRPLLDSLSRSVPNMFSKAYRFVGEMEEISGFVGGDGRTEGALYEAIAGLYGRLAGDGQASKDEIDALRDFFEARRS